MIIANCKALVKDLKVALVRMGIVQKEKYWNSTSG